jgi:hypothetical protein
MSEHVKNLLFQEISKALELAYSAKEEEVKEDKKKEEKERERKKKSGYLIRFLKSYWGLLARERFTGERRPRVPTRGNPVFRKNPSMVYKSICSPILLRCTERTFKYFVDQPFM